MWSFQIEKIGEMDPNEGEANQKWQNLRISEKNGKQQKKEGRLEKILSSKINFPRGIEPTEAERTWRSGDANFESCSRTRLNFFWKAVNSYIGWGSHMLAALCRKCPLWCLSCRGSGLCSPVSWSLPYKRSSSFKPNGEVLIGFTYSRLLRRGICCWSFPCSCCFLPSERKYEEH